MHVETKVAFAIPHFEIGGAQGLFECFALLLQDFFYKHRDSNLADKVYKTFAHHEMHFIKNSNRSLVPYSSQFKHRILHKISAGHDFNQQVCDVVNEQWLNNLMTNTIKGDFITPLQLMKNLILQNT